MTVLDKFSRLSIIVVSSSLSEVNVGLIYESSKATVSEPSTIAVKIASLRSALSTFVP